MSNFETISMGIFLLILTFIAASLDGCNEATERQDYIESIKLDAN